jgi:hypothetical protein
MSIKDVLDGLSDEQRRQLMYAFEHQFSQFIKLPKDTENKTKFIGVNVKPIKHLRITEEAGVWATGEVLGDSDG